MKHSQFKTLLLDTQETSQTLKGKAWLNEPKKALVFYQKAVKACKGGDTGDQLTIKNKLKGSFALLVADKNAFGDFLNGKKKTLVKFFNNKEIIRILAEATHGGNTTPPLNQVFSEFFLKTSKVNNFIDNVLSFKTKISYRNVNNFSKHAVKELYNSTRVKDDTLLRVCSYAKDIGRKPSEQTDSRSYISKLIVRIFNKIFRHSRVIDPKFDGKLKANIEKALTNGKLPGKGIFADKNDRRRNSNTKQRPKAVVKQVSKPTARPQPGAAVANVVQQPANTPGNTPAPAKKTVAISSYNKFGGQPLFSPIPKHVQERNGNLSGRSGLDSSGMSDLASSSSVNTSGLTDLGSSVNSSGLTDLGSSVNSSGLSDLDSTSDIDETAVFGA